VNKQDIDFIIQATLKAADPREAVLRHVSVRGSQWVVDGAAYDLINKDVRLVAVGKAAVPMAEAVGELIGERISRGVVATKYGHGNWQSAIGNADGITHRSELPIANCQLIEAAHPIPDENSLRAGEAICELLQGCTENTLVIACISGGASALVVAPQSGISLNTMRAINDALLRSGADIREMNAVRSRLDRLKAGGLVRLAQPAQVIGLILSDVIGDPLEVIASGMTHEARAHNTLVGNNTQACEAAATAARALGYEATIVTTQMRGEARERGAEIAQSLITNSQLPITRQAFIYGGETTVTIRGDGKGGRNQELALAAAITLNHSTTQPITVIALGTDGTDGPTNAAGAIATHETVARAVRLGLAPQDFLARNDSYHFFEKLGDLIVTGPTGTNVADVVIALRD
jgi:hydroxypyruvate reductase